MPLPTPSSFLLLHGWENERPPGHWQRWLATELTARGHDVRYPQLPDPHEPDPEAWRATIRANLSTLTEGPVTVLAHSLGTVAWLALQAGDAPVEVDRVALVGPPALGLVAQEPAMHAFAPESRIGPAGHGPLRLGARSEAVVVAGDDDPWLPLGVVDTWRPLVDVPLHVVPGGGHLTPESGYGEWPAVLAWALGATGGEAFGEAVA